MLVSYSWIGGGLVFLIYKVIGNGTIDWKNDLPRNLTGSWRGNGFEAVQVHLSTVLRYLERRSCCGKRGYGMLAERKRGGT